MTKTTAGLGRPTAAQINDEHVDLSTGETFRFTAAGWVTADSPADPPPPPPPPPNPPPPVAGSVYDTLISDQRDPHVSLPDGVPLSYDWSQHPRTGLGLNGGGSWANAWGQIYSSNNPATNTLVQVANLQLWLLNGGTWTKLVDCKPRGGRGIDAGFFRSDYAGNITSPEQPLALLDGSRAGEPNPAYNLHFFPQGRVQLPQGYTCIVGCFDARLVLQAPNGVDDRASSRFIASCGGDYYSSAGGLPPRGDWTEGRFRRVTNDWTTYTCHAGVIPPNNPPPLVLASGGAQVPNPPPVEPPPVVTPPGTWTMPSGTVKIMPVGDSITWHQGNDPTGWATMPARFATAGLNVITVGDQSGRNGIKHQGIGAWCIDDTGGACTHANGFHAGGINDHIVEWLAAQQPHIVVVNAGANDGFTGRGAGAAAALDKMLGLIKQNRPQAMVLVTIPRSWSDIPALHSPDLGWSLREFEGVVSARARSMNVRLFDQYKGFGGQASGDWRDYVHESEAGTAKMMTATFDAIMALRT